MSQSANVTSIDALKRFRLSLQHFEHDARTAITELELEMRRAVEWIEVDRPQFWRNELRKAADGVSAAQAALHQKQLTIDPQDTPSCAEEKKALAAAKHRVRFVQDRIQAVQRWRINCSQAADELQGQLSKLSSQLDTDLPRAAAALERLVHSLDAYVRRATISQSLADPPQRPAGVARGSPLPATARGSMTMKVCDLTSGTGRLLRATKTLKQTWAETQTEWKDATRQRFEESYLQPLAPEIQLAISAIEQFQDVLREAERECSEPRHELDSPGSGF